MFKALGDKFTKFVGAIKDHNRTLSPEDLSLLDALAIQDSETEPTSYAYLLLDLAEADQKVDPKEISIIAQVLRTRFDISAEDAREAILNAHAALQAFRGPQSFVDCIREEYSLDERNALIAMIEKVIDADGVREDYELLLRDQFQKLLD